MRFGWTAAAGLILPVMAGCRGPEVGGPLEPAASAGMGGSSTSAGAGGTPAGGTTAFGGGAGGSHAGASGSNGDAGALAFGGVSSGGTAPGGGAPSGGAGTGGDPTGGGAGTNGCTDGSTRGDCAVNREVCRGGSWVYDRTCFANACAMVDCGDGTSTCCEGWGRVALNGYTYDTNDALVESFAVTGDRVGVEASFDFNLDYDIGAISLYLSEPVAWERILTVLVELEVAGDPLPTPDISFELQGTGQGAAWWLEPAGASEWITPVDLYMPGVLWCFDEGCPAIVDLINIRVRPIGVESGGSSAARLAVHGVLLELG